MITNYYVYLMIIINADQADYYAIRTICVTDETLHSFIRRLHEVNHTSNRRASTHGSEIIPRVSA